MPRKRSPRKSAGTVEASGQAQWIWVMVLASLVFGGLLGFFIGQASSGSGAVDQYGRSPGSAHYRHNHP